MHNRAISINKANVGQIEARYGAETAEALLRDLLSFTFLIPLSDGRKSIDLRIMEEQVSKLVQKTWGEPSI